MRSISYRIEDMKSAVISLGFVGENERTQVILDSAKVFGEYPEAVPTLAVIPPEGAAYPKTVTRDGNSVIWEVTDSDLAAEGDGEIQLTFTEGSVVAKSYTGRFRVCRSIVADGEAPDPVTDWITEANEKLAAAEEATTAATGAASAANAAADAIDDMTVAASGLSAGASPTVQISEVSGHKHIAFGIPQGAKGDPGDPGDPSTIIDDTSTAANKVWSASKSGELMNALHGKIDKSEIATQLETEAIINEYTEGEEDMIIEATYTNPVSGNPYFVTTDDADDIVNAYKNGKHIVARLKYVNEAETFGIHGDIYTSMLGYEPGYSKDGQTRLESFNFANGNCAIRTTFEAEGIGLIYKVYKNNNGKLVFEIYVD